jgi:hypothetical protein
MKTMLNPQGRLDPVTFRNAAMILIAIGAIFSLLPVVQPALTMLSFLSLVLIYPWIVIWVKRLHDAGKSGWMFLGVLVLWVVVGQAANFFIVRRFVPPQPPVDPHNLLASVTAQMQANALPGTAVSVIIALAFVLLANALLRSSPQSNV